MYGSLFSMLVTLDTLCYKVIFVLTTKLEIKGKKKTNQSENQIEQKLVRKPKERTHNKLDSLVESPVLLFKKTHPYTLGSLGLPTY